MHLSASDLIVAATDLSNFLACPHVTTLDLSATKGGPKPPKFDDPAKEVLRKRGLEHETKILQTFRDSGLSVVAIPKAWHDDPAERWSAQPEATLEAMRSGADIIYQGCLFDGRWIGLPDFLKKVDHGSELGTWSYEVIDAKLAREAKAGAVLQITLYSHLLSEAQGVDPEHMHLALGRLGGGMESFRYHDFAAYYRSVRSRLLEAVAGHSEDATYPDPVTHCDVCAWTPNCRKRWREDDHLSLVAGISRKQREKLAERGVSSLAALGRLELPIHPPLESVSSNALTTIHEQARIQLEGRQEDRHKYELFTDVADGFGLSALPKPSPGDLFFDIESDPHVLDEGLEYLFGYCDSAPAFEGLWALGRAAEKRVFERFIDMVTGRLGKYPHLHVYHFGAYEPAALKRLASRHGTREEELDRLLRGQVFVDLHRVVKQSLRASVESYSIKKLEPLYDFGREVDLREANSALAHFEAWLALGETQREESELLQQIEGYNKDDCVSTLRLRQWLEERREELASLTRRSVPRPEQSPQEATESLQEELDEVSRLFDALTAGVPADPAERSAEQHAHWILANLLSWHRREDKSVWWEYFRCFELDAQEMIQDRSTLGGMTYQDVVGKVKKSLLHRYRFPVQDHGVEEGDQPRDPATKRSAGTVHAIDDVQGIIDLKRGKKSEAPHPTALVPFDRVDDKILRESLVRLAGDITTNGLASANNRAAVDLLLRRPPRCGSAGGSVLKEPGETTAQAARRLAPQLERTVLAVQGPPGAGKTYTGARMIVDLLQGGKRVGVTATGHKVISHLLANVCDAAAEASVPVCGIQKASERQWCGRPQVEHKNDNAKVLEALTDGSASLAAGTAWLWARPEMAGSVDVLFVDEAGQMSLANVLAICQAGASIVLLGDPRQLEKPQKGVHPPGTGVSALEHLVGEADTMPPDRGLFLDKTWRLSPDICAFTSELYYANRLESRSGLEVQRIVGPALPTGSGLRFLPVEHTGNTSDSPEEVEAVFELFEQLVSGGYTWTDQHGNVKRLTSDDILIVAPYNAQVARLKDRLPSDAKVGTVDKFQGQEAAITIFSSTSSSADDAPRGMEFLYNPNRLNVATSRARCLAVIVGSPALFAPDCGSVRQMQLANGFCRFGEMSVDVAEGTAQ